MEDYRLTQTGQEVQNILDNSTPIQDLNAEIQSREGADQTLQGNIDAEARAREGADQTLQGNIDAINTKIPSGASASNKLATTEDLLSKQDTLTFDNMPIKDSNNPVKSGGVFDADKALSDAIEAILVLIPSAATALNQLADKAFVNSSIATATATFRGTYNLVTDLSLAVTATHAQIATALLGAISTADNNDYCFVQVPTSSETPTEIRVTERYKFDGTAWAYEYDLNNSGYTADQWAAINSGITAALVSKLSALPTNADLTTALGLLSDGIATINGKIPSEATTSNKLVDTAAMQSYVTQIIGTISATFNVASADGHVAVQITQVNGVITNVAVTTNDIASAAALTLVTGRVTDAEANIVSLGGRMTTAETDIDDLQQLYNNLLQSAPVVIEPTDTWPVAVADRSATVIYRVVDRVNTPPQYYSDYMFRDSDLSGQPVLMAQYDNAIDPRPKKGSQNLVSSGGVFDNMGAMDVSELNATENPHTLATYADLSAALAAIPSDYQKGGMSIKFVCSSDNKYVQYRLTKDEWSVLVNDWKSADDYVEETDHPITEENVVGYLTDKNKSIIGKLMKNGSVVFLELNNRDKAIDELLTNVSTEVPDNGNGIIKYLTDKNGKIIATINNVGDTNFYGGGGFDGEITKSRSIGFDAVKVLTDNKNNVIGWITSKGSIHIVEAEFDRIKVSDSTDIGIPSQLFPILGFIANGAHMRNFVNDKAYNLLFSADGKYQKEGAPIETVPMLVLQDDDTMDYQIPISCQRGATDETAPTAEYNKRGGYISIMLPLLLSLNAKYGEQINAENHKIVMGCAAEGQRIGLTPLYGHEDTFNGLNINGRILKKVIEHEGWESMCHSMTARYLEDNYIVNGLDSSFAQLVLQNSIWRGDLHWGTTTCYNTNDGKNYQIKEDKSGWDELPAHYIKPYCYIYIEVDDGQSTQNIINTTYQEQYDSGIRVLINPTYSVKYQVNTWFERAKLAELPYVDRAGVNWGSSHSIWHMKESLKYADYFFGRYTETNEIPLDTVIHRYDYTPKASRNGAGNLENYNVYTEKEYNRLISAIDSCLGNKGLTVLFSHASTLSNVNYYLSGLTYPTERAGDRLNYTDSNYPDEWTVPLRWAELNDLLNNSDSEYWTVPPLHKRNLDGTLSDERMESWAEYYPCPGTTPALLYDVLRYAISHGVRFASSKECISAFANMLSIGIKNAHADLWAADPLLGNIPEENNSYCIIGADGSVDYYSHK